MTAHVCMPHAAATAALVAALVLHPADASAANLQPAGINLGGTSFMDGFGRNKGGFTYFLYFQYARSRAIHGSLIAGGDASKPLPVFNEPEIDVFVLINQLAYTLPDDLFGGVAHVGMNFVLPAVAFDVSFAPPTREAPQNGTLSDNGIGLGDLTFGPMLQFAPIEMGGRPFFSHRIEVDMVVPTGAYDPGIDINQSSNFVSIIPYWAGTVLPLPIWEISVRLHYLYNFKNLRPALGRYYTNDSPPTVDSAQAGQAGWANFATSLEVLKGLRLGANGYYFHQFNLDKWEETDGTSHPGIRYHDNGLKKIFGVGPGVMWAPGQDDKLYANLYFQLHVVNGPHANVLNLRWVHGFP
jgi:hypothetical protein